MLKRKIDNLLFLIFSSCMLLLLVFLNIFDYQSFFLPHREVLFHPVQPEMFYGRKFIKTEIIELPEVKGKVLHNFENGELLQGEFTLDPSVYLEGVRSLRMLAYRSQDSSFVYDLPEPIKNFQSLNFYLYVHEMDSVSDFIVSLTDSSGAVFETRIRGGLAIQKWSYIVLAKEQFFDPFKGTPKDIVKINFNLQALDDSEAEVNVDYLVFEDNRSLIQDWNLIESNAISLEQIGDQTNLVFQNNPRDLFALYNRTGPTGRAEIIANVSSSLWGATCGLVLQGERADGEHGILFTMAGPGTSTWTLMNFSKEGRALIGNGKLENWILGRQESIWMKLFVDEDLISVFLGKSLDDLELQGVFKAPVLDPGLAGLVSIDNSRCNFKDVIINYDPAVAYDK